MKSVNFPKTPHEGLNIESPGNFADSVSSSAHRASRYVATLPAAISGSRGHDALFRVACVLAHDFDLSDATVWPILLEYNARCLPPWSERELRHKLSQARKVTHREPAGHLLGERSKPEPNRPPRILGRISVREDAVAPVESHPVESEILRARDDCEARRVAGELSKMQRDGVLLGPHDPNAALFAAIIRTFGGTHISRWRQVDADSLLPAPRP